MHTDVDWVTSPWGYFEDDVAECTRCGFLHLEEEGIQYDIWYRKSWKPTFGFTKLEIEYNE